MRLRIKPVYIKPTHAPSRYSASSSPTTRGAHTDPHHTRPRSARKTPLPPETRGRSRTMKQRLRVSDAVAPHIAGHFAAARGTGGSRVMRRTAGSRVMREPYLRLGPSGTSDQGFREGGGQSAGRTVEHFNLPIGTRAPVLSQERACGRALGARPPASVGGHPVRPCGMAAATTAWAASRRPPRGGAPLLMKARGPSSRPLRRALGFPAATARCGPISSVHVSQSLPTRPLRPPARPALLERRRRATVAPHAAE